MNTKEIRRSVNDMEIEEFSKCFMESVCELYAEWVEDNQSILPDFELAIKRAERQGIVPATLWTGNKNT